MLAITAGMLALYYDQEALQMGLILNLQSDGRCQILQKMAGISFCVLNACSCSENTYEPLDSTSLGFYFSSGHLPAKLLQLQSACHSA